MPTQGGRFDLYVCEPRVNVPHGSLAYRVDEQDAREIHVLARELGEYVGIMD